MADLFAMFLNIKYTTTAVYQNTIIFNGVSFNNIYYETCILNIIPNRLIFKLWLKQPTQEQYNNPNLIYNIDNIISFEHIITEQFNKQINQQYLQNLLREKLSKEQSLKEQSNKEIELKKKEMIEYVNKRNKLRNEYKYLAQEYINPIEDCLYNDRRIKAKDKIIPEIVFENTGKVHIIFKLNGDKIMYKLYVLNDKSFLNYRNDGYNSAASLKIINKIKPQLKLFYEMTMEHNTLTKKINDIKNSLEEEDF